MDKQVLEKAIQMINSEDYACVVIVNGKITEGRFGRGIAPLLGLYDEGLLNGVCLVDKVIGRASAMVMTEAGVAEVYGLTMSRDAAGWFASHGVPYSCGEEAELILNRTLTGICPMDETVQNIDDSKEAIPALKAKIEELRAKAGTGK